MSTIALLRRVAERTGTSAETAGRICQLTVRAIGEQLSPEAALRIGGDLPPTVASWLSGPRAATLTGLPILLARVSQQAPALGEAQVRAVCEAMAAALRPAGLVALRSALPADVGALFPQPDVVAR
jgi:uncharacterized protein (DUF2267 family)